MCVISFTLTYAPFAFQNHALSLMIFSIFYTRHTLPDIAAYQDHILPLIYTVPAFDDEEPYLRTYLHLWGCIFNNIETVHQKVYEGLLVKNTHAVTGCNINLGH